MTSITLKVTGAKAAACVSGPLTSGMVGIPVTIQYDDAWNGLTKNLVCCCGKWAPGDGETRTVLDVAQTATVAHEVMKADMLLYLGVEGYSADGKLVMPTTWADCGRILPGANAGADSSADPVLSVWAQLQAQIRQIQEQAVTDERIAAAVAAYLEKNPVGDSGSSQGGGLTDAQIEALDGMFRVCAYIREDVSAEYGIFKSAFGITDSGEGHVHQYTSAVTVAPTCTTDGVRSYTCSCGSGYTEVIPATGHYYVNGVCTDCGEADPTYIPGITLTRISATYAGGDVPVGTALTDLTGIVVTAHYSNGTTAVKTDYTLSGTIAQGENTITVSYGGKTTAITVTGVAEKTLTHISAAYSGGAVPVGTAVTNLTGIVVTAHYSDGTTAVKTDYTLSGTIAQGENTITVSYGGKTTAITVTGVAEKTLTHISAVYSGGAVPVDTALTDLTGIVVTAHYSDGTTAIKTDYTLSGIIAQGENTITVSYGGKTATITVTGEAEKTLTHISAAYNGGTVAIGSDAAALSRIVVTAHYSNGASEAVTGYTLSGTIAEGENTITVSYEGMTTTFTVVGGTEELLLSNPDASVTMGFYTTADVVPAVLLKGYNADTHSTMLSGKTITRVTLSVHTAGTISIGKADITALGTGAGTIMLEQQVFDAVVGDNTFAVNLPLGETETLAIHNPGDTGKIYAGKVGTGSDAMMVLTNDRYKNGNTDIPTGSTVKGEVYGFNA